MQVFHRKVISTIHTSSSTSKKFFLKKYKSKIKRNAVEKTHLYDFSNK